MSMVFSTLFDSYYLDKGLAMYESLVRATDDFVLYVFLFDEKSFEVLNKLNLKNVRVISVKELEREYPNLLELKKERSKAEFCWTCTPLTIEYILNQFGESSCTYIDADLYFFSNPQILFSEIEQAKANVVITPHRFSNTLTGRYLCRRSGRYCVEFNYFDSSENAREALSWWKEKCFEWCFHLYEPERMGDQKYLERFPELFEGVHVLEHLGAGIAPWNLNQYRIYKEKSNLLIDKATGTIVSPIFYHFQNIRFISDCRVNVCSGTHDKEIKDLFYPDYLREIVRIRKQLHERFGIEFSISKRYSSNKWISFLQGTVLRFKIRSFSDIYNLNKLK